MQKQTLKELENIQKSWTTGVYMEVNSQLDSFDKNIIEFNKTVHGDQAQEIKSQKSKGNLKSSPDDFDMM